jgi:hypothetical protein
LGGFYIDADACEFSLPRHCCDCNIGIMGQ